MLLPRTAPVPNTTTESKMRTCLMIYMWATLSHLKTEILMACPEAMVARATRNPAVLARATASKRTLQRVASSSNGHPIVNLPEGSVPHPPAPYGDDVPVSRYEHLNTPDEADRSLEPRERKSLRLRTNSTEHLMTHKPKNPYCEACIRAKMTEAPSY